jgi:YidC/Oxa1 family membrane protein insertase
MASFKSGNDNQKALALFICLFLAYIYKEKVWDAYFMPQRPVVVQPQQAAPAPSPAPADRFAESSASPVSTETAPSTPTTPSPSTQLTEKTAAETAGRYPSDAQIANEGEVVIETSTITAKISLLGGRITDFRLKKYLADLTNPQTPLNMVDHIEFAPYPLGVYTGSESDAWVHYQLQSAQQVSHGNELQNNPLAPGAENSVVLRGTLPDGREISKTINFHGEGYFVDVAVKIDRPAADASRVGLEWTRLIAKGSASALDPYNTSGYVWFDDQKALRESFAKLSKDEIDLSGVRWITMADKYFMATLISEDHLSPARTLKTDELYRERLYGSDTERRARLFVGPKSYRLLEDAGYELKRTIDFGRTGIIAAPLLSLLHVLHDILGNYGLAIIMLTIIVKLGLYPLTASSFKQMKAMQELAPELKKIKESNKDKQQQQMETMQLYRERGVNPLGGCFPMLVQMPVFIGLYSALLLDIELRHAPFALWIHDLSAPEKLMIGNIAVPVMVLLFIISMLIQQWTTPSNMDPTQRKAMLVMPLVFGFMFAKMPAGLTLYWLTNNLISIGQQAGLRGKYAEKGGSAFKLTAMIAAAVFLFALLITKVF